MASKNKRKQTFKEYSRSWDFIKPSRREKTMQGVRCVPLISALALLQVEDTT